MSGVKVSVHVTGGALGLDRLVEVVDGVATVSEKGEARTTILAPEQVARLDTAADRLAQASPAAIAPLPDVADAGQSEIAITDGETNTSLVVPAGADAPDEVWDLLEVVDEVCEDA